MNRCKDCKWWDAISAAGVPPTSGTCFHHEFDAPELDYGYSKSPAHCSGSGGEYSTSTGPEFGCVHWEAQE